MKLSECRSVADLQAMADAAEGDMACFWYVEDGELMPILQANVRFVANLETGRFDWYELACADDDTLGCPHEAELFTSHNEAAESLAKL